MVTFTVVFSDLNGSEGGRFLKTLPETWDLLPELISYYLLFVYNSYKGSNKSFIPVCTTARNQFYFCKVSKILMLKM